MGEITNLKKVLFSSVLIVMYFFGLPAQAKYGGGSGTAGDPYRIYNAGQMNAIGADSNDWDKHFRLMADIDLSAFTGKEFNIIGRYGRPFSGTFDGNGYTISNFTYTSTDIHGVGLFRCVYDANALIKDVELINPNIDAGTGSYVGSLVGMLIKGTISGCYVKEGSVSGTSNVGGLVGIKGTLSPPPHPFTHVINCGATVDVIGDGDFIGGLVGIDFFGRISSCYAAGNTVSSGDAVGGLVGLHSNGSIYNSCATGTISGTRKVGGLVGENYSGITNCYSTVSVEGENSVGGLAGWNTRTITNSYSAGSVTGANDVGGLIGINEYGTVMSSFWDIETSGLNNMCGGQGPDGSGCDNANGKTTVQMQTESTFTDAGWDFVGETANGTDDIWKMRDGPYYPRLSWEIRWEGTGEPDDPYLIYNAIQMNAIGVDSNDWDKHFLLCADIDLGGYKGTRFNIIGNSSDYFTGVFDGNGHTISNFTWNSTRGENIGLFGTVVGGEITNLGLIDPNIDTLTGFRVGSLAGHLVNGTVTGCYAKGGSVSGDASIGGLVGENYSIITECYSTSSVSGDLFVGGLAGHNYDSTIIKCYSSSSVSGNQYVGGLVGVNGGDDRLATITNCYSMGSISGGSCVGGLVGINYEATITNCYSVGNVTGNVTVGGLVGDNRCWEEVCSTINNSYWDIETSNEPNMCGYQDAGSAGCDPNYGRTTSQMMQKSTFAGWDFWTTWSICEGMAHPRLQWQGPPRDFLCLDGVNFIDYSFLASHWQEDDCGISNNCKGADLDKLGTVDINDLAIFIGNWLVEPPPRPLPASNPNPYEGTIGVDINDDLSWMAGSYATSHDVYFGTSDPPPFIGNQIPTTFDPGTMDYITIYYWRIDEVNM